MSLLQICHTDTHTHTHNCFTALWIIRHNLDKQISEETCTHSHLSWSSVIPYLLPLSITIHGILPVQLTCLTVFSHNLSPSFLSLGLAPSTSYSIHFFIQPLSSLSSTWRYHHNLFSYSTKIMSSNPSHSLNLLLTTLSRSLMPHIYLTILISTRWSATSFSFLKCHATFTHNRCAISLSLSMIYLYW